MAERVSVPAPNKLDTEMIKHVIKRNGTKEEFDPVKLNKWCEWAC